MWWILILLLLVFVFLTVFEKKSTQKRGYSDESVDGILIQKVLLATKKQLPPGYEPIDTVYVNRSSDGTVSARFLFLNLGKYSGTQYDVTANMNADGTVTIQSIDTSVPSELEAAYKPFLPDQAFAQYQPIKSSDFK
jgi:hypothetical protein